MLWLESIRLVSDQILMCCQPHSITSEPRMTTVPVINDNSVNINMIPVEGSMLISKPCPPTVTLPQAFNLTSMWSSLDWWHTQWLDPDSSIQMIVICFFSLQKVRRLIPRQPPPPLFFLKMQVSLCSQIPLFLARVSPHRLSELRQLWPSVSWRVACELVTW